MEQSPLERSLSDADVTRMERNAWREAARAWAEYRQAAYGTPTDPSTAAVAQILHDAAWSAEHAWRRLHDERVRRGLPILVADAAQRQDVLLGGRS